jgi:hypothetical protein
LVLGKKKFYKFNKEGYSEQQYHKDLCEMTNLPIDTESYTPVAMSTGMELLKLLKTGDLSLMKTIDYSTALKDICSTPTSDKF